MKKPTRARVAAGVLLAMATVASNPAAVSAACGDAAGPGVNWNGCDKTGVLETFNDFTGATFDGTDFTDADIGHSDLTNLNAPDVILTNSLVDVVVLDKANFLRAEAPGANFNFATLNSPPAIPAGDAERHINFFGANLASATFQSANLQNAYFANADLSNAFLAGAEIRQAVFVGANLSATVFDAVPANGLTGTNFMYTPDGAADPASTAFETPVAIPVLTNDENLNTTNHGRTFLPVNVSTPANGTAAVQADGSITYTPDAGFSGIDTFTYQPESTLPAAWTLPIGVAKVSTGPAVTVTVTVAPNGVTPPSPYCDPTDPILGATYQGMSGADGRISRLYAAFYNRQPDSSGFAYWQSLIAGGITIKSTADFFGSSPEFVDRYGSSVSDTAYVTLLYANTLCRAPDAGGMAYWLDLMGNGLSRGEVALWFSESPEFKNRTQTS